MYKVLTYYENKKPKIDLIHTALDRNQSLYPVLKCYMGKINIVNIPYSIVPYNDFTRTADI